MCRLLGYVSASQTNIPKISGRDFSDFLALSQVHKDSWGLALDTGHGSEVIKSAETAISSERFHSSIQTEATGGLLHFRWASPGLAITDENAHPFTRDGISFIHNGAIQPYEALVGSIPAELLEFRIGTGDSELFFLFAMSKIRYLGLREGVLETIRTLKSDFSYSSINSMFLSEDTLVVISEHNPNNRPSWSTPEYYELRYRLDEAGCLVASSGWNQSGWVLMPNHSALIVDRKNMTVELLSI
jgi:predicted glutamine amidotransferase